MNLYVRAWSQRLALGLLMLVATAQGQAAQDPTEPDQAAQALACSYTIHLYAPTSGANYTAPATVAFSADAGGSPDGCEVGIVKFYNGATLLAQVSPDVNGLFSYNWTGVAAGSYTVKAVTGNGAATATATITVSPPANQLPSVTMGTPTGSPFIAPAAVGLSANASDADGTITKVEFFQGSNLIATDTAAPYTSSFTASSAGTYSFTAKATDNTGASTTSAPVSATVSANSLPSVSITAPANAASYISPATISISANASDSDGTITKVDFYANGALLSSDTSSPYAASWSTGNIGGTFPITATATDDKGGQKSASINVVLNTPTGSLSASPTPCTITSGDNCLATISWTSNDSNAEIWRHYDFYYQGGTDEAHSATKVGTGTSGSAQFDIGGSKRNQYFELKSGGAVITSVTPRSNYPAWTTLTAPTAAQLFQAPTSITVSATATDADGSVNRVEFYADGALIATDTTAPYSTVWSNAPTGNHVLGAQAFDNDGASRTQVTASVAVNAQPTVAQTTPSNGTLITLGSGVTFAANAADSDGTISKVEFYADGALLATDTTSPYSYAWTPTTAKTYALTTKSYDDRGGTAVSAASTLVVNQPPAVTLTSPTAGTIVNAPGSVTLTANASDSDGSVSKVEFYRDGVLITTDSAAPFSYVWSGIAAGQYAITAKAYDDRGATSTTAATNLIINGLPSGSITYPTSGAVVVAPASLLIQTSVSDPDDGVAIVEFWVDGVHRATDTAAPFTLQADNMPAGTYSLQIRVFDNQGGATWSAVSTLIVNERPQVALVSPSDDTGLVVPATITLAATASDADGSIDRVEFYDGSTLIGT
ncbi:MAG TPA: Ig-like domain-containing protein, partial [Lysobacter sp.]